MTDKTDQLPWDHAIMYGEEVFNFLTGKWQFDLTDDCCYSEQGCINLLQANKRLVEEGTIPPEARLANAELVFVSEDESA